MIRDLTPKPITVKTVQKEHLYKNPVGNYFEHRASYSDSALFRKWYSNSNGELQMSDDYVILNDHYIRHLKEVKLNA